MSELRALDSVLRNASQLRLSEVHHDGRVSVDLSHAPVRDRLRTAMAVRALTGSICACVGDVRFEFLNPRGECLADVVLHHGEALRWNGWQGLAALKDGGSLLRWLTEHGLAGPLTREEEAYAARRRGEAEEADWVAAVPPALAGLTSRMLALSRTGSAPSPAFLADAHDRLRQADPDPVSRVLLLLAWCGAGSGRYSGFPVHEVLPDRLLADVPIEEIVAALEDPTADRRHDAGAVRHLVGWKTRRQQKRDVAALPAPLRARLVHAARASADATIGKRAEHWPT
ncbi:hypothetical protein J7E93_36565 [Streptomyces sp. ISL-36]|uniref:hypothetical protein n=1 Tax=Streptomyces sp. ISL-36 TaxID=2819182 RepID=UPI001BE6FF5A|nr:hypothetical protein [Streptomyces sp. ISL-36]MBT2445499.1 hypothetical protein [Streptomyces sp. ISL-36]